ncbi:hypothetical protein ACFV9E_43845, partial [Streptomyces sp. NPDC059835]
MTEPTCGSAAFRGLVLARGLLAAVPHAAHAAAPPEILAWGDEQYGQTDVPAAVREGASAIGAGAFHLLAVRDGAVYAWASNPYGK